MSTILITFFKRIQLFMKNFIKILRKNLINTMNNKIFTGIQLFKIQISRKFFARN